MKVNSNNNSNNNRKRAWVARVSRSSKLARTTWDKVIEVVSPPLLQALLCNQGCFIGLTDFTAVVFDI